MQLPLPTDWPKRTQSLVKEDLVLQVAHPINLFEELNRQVTLLDELDDPHLFHARPQEVATEKNQLHTVVLVHPW